MSTPPTTFTTILADPPWPDQGGERHYQTMSLERIASLPVSDLAADDAHLWLWTTNALLRQAYEVAEAWGFAVRSPLTWVKFRLGLSCQYQLRNATEQLLFCTRGRAPVNFRSQPTWLQAPVQEHSRKPWACAQGVDGLFMRLLSRPLGVVRIRWGICRPGWCGCGGGCRSLRSRWRPRCRPGRGW